MCLKGILVLVLGLTITVVNAQINWNYDSNNALSWAMNCDFWGNDLSKAKTNGESCGPRCKNTADCTHFTWTNFEEGTCWMKSGQVSKSDAYAKSGAVCGILDGGNNSGTKLNDIYTTRHGATEMGACELPRGDYSVRNPVALGDFQSLSYLRFDPKLCGHILRINCGKGDMDIIVTNSNFGGGLDLYASSWAKATGNLPPGTTKCSVQLTDRNTFNSNGYKCYHATGETNNAYYRNVGLLNTNARLVVKAQFNGRWGQHRGNNPYFAFDGQGSTNDQVTFYFEDGGSHSVRLSDCASGANKEIWS